MTAPNRVSTDPGKKPKRSVGQRITRWWLGVFGPSVLIGLGTWLALRHFGAGTEVANTRAMWCGVIAGLVFFFVWQGLSMRLKRAGRSAAFAFRSFVLTLLFIACAVALVWYLVIRP